MLAQHARSGQQRQRQHRTARWLKSLPRDPYLRLAPDGLLVLARAESDDHGVELLPDELLPQIPRKSHAHFEVHAGIGRGEARQDRWQFVRDEILRDAEA